MIRVASLVSYQVMPAKMGGQKGIYLFLKYFSRHCDVICYITENNLPSANEPFRIKKILSNSKLRYINPFYFFTLKKDFKKEAITHLIIEHPYYGWLGVLLKWFAAVKLIVHSHNIESLRFRDTGKWWWRMLWLYERFTYSNADKVFFISEEDRKYANEHFRLDATKNTVITYGTEQPGIPSEEEIKSARKKICEKHNIHPEEIILLYNGTLDYKPNLSGLDLILNEINPLLQQQKDYSYTIVICGSKLPESYSNLESYKDQKIVYAGFVDSIREYFLAADIFINPILEGGGIKTKLVEALAANCTCVSFRNGAFGIPSAITGRKLFIVSNDNAMNFADTIKKAVEMRHENIPADFYDHFYWDNIAGKAARFI